MGMLVAAAACPRDDESARHAKAGPEPAALAPSPPEPRCPVVPMKLVVRGVPSRSMTMLELAADGRVSIGLPGGSTLQARLDSRGCLVGPDGVWAELAPDGSIWTPHESLSVDGSTIRLPTGALRIADDGRVERLDADGNIETQPDGGFALEGYGAPGRCSGLLLLATFMGMMPSMAVVDGHPAREPAPAGSHCDVFRPEQPQ